MRRLVVIPVVVLLIAFSFEGDVPAAETPVLLPNESASLKFVVLGDFGTGRRGQYALAAAMARVREDFRFDVVVTVGDNLYGLERPADFKRKFEDPYKPLLDAGVKFHAVLGNHDAREQRSYPLFNMGGKSSYSFKAPNGSVRFFMIDSTDRAPGELDWLERELKGSKEAWKLAVFHHPLYSSGKRHGSDVKLREMLEPLFVRYDVAVAFAGHDHVYERIKPQRGIVHFVVGSGGQLAVDGIDKRSALTAVGFDTDHVFLAVEIAGSRMYFNAISSGGRIVDSGIIERRVPADGTQQPPGPGRRSLPSLDAP